MAKSEKAAGKQPAKTPRLTHASDNDKATSRNELTRKAQTQAKKRASKTRVAAPEDNDQSEDEDDNGEDNIIREGGDSGDEYGVGQGDDGYDDNEADEDMEEWEGRLAEEEGTSCRATPWLEVNQLSWQRGFER
jgi:hypothetical protein